MQPGEQVATTCPFLLSARHEKSAGSGVGMNSYAILFQKTCAHPCNTSYTQCTALLEYSVFGIRIGGVRMRSKIIPLLPLLPPRIDLQRNEGKNKHFSQDSRRSNRESNLRTPEYETRALTTEHKWISEKHDVKV
jgi:hypothetical protein